MTFSLSKANWKTQMAYDLPHPCLKKILPSFVSVKLSSDCFLVSLPYCNSLEKCLPCLLSLSSAIFALTMLSISILKMRILMYKHEVIYPRLHYWWTGLEPWVSSFRGHVRIIILQREIEYSQGYGEVCEARHLYIIDAQKLKAVLIEGKKENMAQVKQIWFGSRKYLLATLQTWVITVIVSEFCAYSDALWLNTIVLSLLKLVLLPLLTIQWEAHTPLRNDGLVCL